MTDTEVQDVIQETVTPAVEDQPSEHLDANAQVENTGEDSGTSEESQETDKDYNFRQMRDQMRVMESDRERLARENEDFKKALIEAVNPRAPVEPEVDDLAGVAQDDWTTREQADLLARRQAESVVAAALKKDREERLKQELPDLLKRQFSDFDEVVTKENVDYLRTHKPHIAATLGATQDPYAQAASAYEYIKAFCPKVNTDDKERAARNAQKPGTLGNAQATSPLSQAKTFENGHLSSEMKVKLQQEMAAAARSY